MEDYVDVKLPNGNIAKFPSTMSHDEISSILRKQFPIPKQESYTNQLTRGPRNVAAGFAKLGHKLLNLPSRHLESMGSHGAAELLKFRPDYNYDEALGLPKEKQWHDVAAQLMPELMGAFAVPELEGSALLSQIPRVGKYLNKILGQGLPQAGYAALMSEPNQAGESASMAAATMAPFSIASQLTQSTSPLARMAAQGIGGIMGYELGKNVASAAGASPFFADVGGLGLGALGARGMTSSRMMQQRLTENMNPDVVKERLEAARRLGLDYLTPAEASLSPFLGARQGALGKTPEGSRMMLEKAQSRVESEEKAINEFLESIYDKNQMEKIKNAAYEESKGLILPERFIKKFKDNEIVKKAEKEINLNAAYREELKGVNRDSLEYWDLIKRAIQDMEKTSPKEQARIYGNTRKSLIAEMDKSSPYYKIARSLAEREITKGNLQKAFDKADPSGKSFYKVLASKVKFEKLLHSLRNVPGGQQKAKDMRLIFNDLINPPSIRATAALERTSMNKSRSDVQEITNMIGNALSKGKYDKQMIEFVTNPKWDEMMKEINKISDKQKRISKFVEYFGKGISQNMAHQEEAQ